MTRILEKLYLDEGGVYGVREVVDDHAQLREEVLL